MSEKTIPQVLEATPQFVEGYGYLYLFDLTDDGRPFNHMSQVFVERKISGDAPSVYSHIKKIGHDSIVSINRNNPEKTPEAVSENAKLRKDKMVEEKRKKEKEARNIEKSKADNAPTQEWLDNFFEESKRKLKEQDQQAALEKARLDMEKAQRIMMKWKKSSRNWYNKIGFKN